MELRMFDLWKQKKDALDARKAEAKKALIPTPGIPPTPILEKTKGGDHAAPTMSTAVPVTLAVTLAKSLISLLKGVPQEDVARKLLEHLSSTIAGKES
jgi:hypothetical protein